MVGPGPGRYTSLRMGLDDRPARSPSRSARPWRVSATLGALAAGADGALPVIDARRREVFTLEGRAAICVRPGDLPVSRTALCRRRCGALPRAARGDVAPSSPRTTTPVTFPGHATTPGSPDFGAAALVEPIYLRAPDADRALCGHGSSDDRAPTADAWPISARSSKIERRAYPTPWSRSMFAGELAKPTSLCVGAFDTADKARLVGYLIVSRYVDAWHVMNLAVDEPYRRRGIARQLLDELFAATMGDAMRGYTLEVRVSNQRCDRALRGGRLSGQRACGAATTRTIGRTRTSCGRTRFGAAASRRLVGPLVILGLETSCDETAAACVSGTARFSRASSPPRQTCMRATGASCPRSPRAGISS